MSDRLSDPVAFGRRVGIVLEPVTDFPSERMQGLALARNNGRVCRECEVPMPRGNPYRKGSKKHAAFIEGYEWCPPAAPQGAPS